MYKNIPQQKQNANAKLQKKKKNCGVQFLQLKNFHFS